MALLLLLSMVMPDGYNIMCLITVLFYRLMPKFIEEGRLKWLRAPLYKNKVC